MAHAKHDSLRVLLFIPGRFYCYRQSHVYDLYIVIIVTEFMGYLLICLICTISNLIIIFILNIY